MSHSSLNFSSEPFKPVLLSSGPLTYESLKKEELPSSYHSCKEWTEWWDVITSVLKGKRDDAKTFHKLTKSVLDWLGLVSMNSHLVQPFEVVDDFIAVGKYTGPQLKIWKNKLDSLPPVEPLVKQVDWLVAIEYDHVRICRNDVVVSIEQREEQLHLNIMKL